MIPSISTDAIELDVTAGEAVVVSHGLGRQVQGWICIWSDSFIQFRAAEPDADSSRELVLVPNASGRARLVLF